MKKWLLLLSVLFTIAAQSQNAVGIGTSNPNSSALLELSSTTKGMLAPRMTTLQRTNISNPATGLLVYDTEQQGFMYYNGTEWMNITAPASGSGSGWDLAGNMGTNPSSNFIGTKDAQSLQFKVNNVRHGWLDLQGSIFFGKEAGMSNNINGNVGIGPRALYMNQEKSYLIAIGDSALFHNGLGATQFNEATNNIAIGATALYGNTKGSYNVAMGSGALRYNTTGTFNIGIGFQTLLFNSTGADNVVVGSAMLQNITGSANSVLGNGALYKNTSGSRNVGIGPSALFNNETGNNNIAIGYGTLAMVKNKSGLVAIGDSALYMNAFQDLGFPYSEANTAVGSKALYANTTGRSNSAFGYRALMNNTNAFGNTAVGGFALTANIDGGFNTAVGSEALSSNTSGDDNTAVGMWTMKLANTSSNTAIGAYALQTSTGEFNVGVGSYSLSYTVTGQRNVAVGHMSMRQNRYGRNNVAMGHLALYSADAQSFNVAIGDSALYTTGGPGLSSGLAVHNTGVGSKVLANNFTGYNNTSFGSNSMFNNNSGYYNTAIGYIALHGNTTGHSNVAVGVTALTNNTTGYQNTAVGYNAEVATNNLRNATAIGYGAVVDANDKVVIGNVAVSSIGGYAGWSDFSDQRFKHDVQENVPGLAFINKLRPITYKLDSEEIMAFKNKSMSEEKKKSYAGMGKRTETLTGFMAQEVEQAAKDLGFEFSGVDKPKDAAQQTYALRYSAFVVPLVKAVQEQQSEIEMLKKEVEELKKLIKHQ